MSPGQRLKEEDLTARCGVSRTPVREALRRLGAEGLVVMTPRQGAEVAAVGAEDLEEVYALRAILERYAAARASTRLQESEIARLKVLAAEMETAAAQGPDAVTARFPAANAEFHRIILEAAASPRLRAMAAMVVELPLVLRTLASYSAEERTRSLHHHEELIRAFEARSPDWAGSVMYSHIQSAFFALTRGAKTHAVLASSGGRPLRARGKSGRRAGGKDARAAKHRG